MNPSSEKRHALVIGAGVSGLTTALCLRDRGITSTVVAEKFSPQITSNVAGALWEWPPAVCGYHHDEISLARSKQWCMTSFRKFEALSALPDAGVYVRPVTFYFRNLIEENDFHLTKMKEIEAQVPGFVRGTSLIEDNGVNPHIGLVDAYRHLAPMVDTDVYMKWLLLQVRSAGIEVIERKIEGDLRLIESALKRAFDADVIVNCSGLGARELAGESMYPLRGAIIRLVNDGTRMPKLTQAFCVSHDNVTSDQDIVFIVPRGEDRIVLGAIAEADQWETDIGLHNYEPVRRIYERCTEFLPMLKDAEIDPVEPVRVGLRPFRKGNVRLEQVPGTSVIHNYGHGGAGVTFSWGCAVEVADRVADLFASGNSRFMDCSLVA
ncbi:FAD-dependent oxidoreductase [Trinickia caryophylli]|uniref:D-amino-acid:oxygen oxidoreductase n=1 Tax=Trinickia caryophylli TaxID=28094 RepID=A0A1X7G673_TRICW|nr:FAD-dependent oxidoreductase [Trinickia caryophylli]PMS13939.1 amino acid oxidase [Trinickia caryophylli]TRX14297.1 FAD-binding oxidoreductase [Trinickia caryophylli]WQE14126.1 FAD-dependent oxidoreductase [Trinickia caryophylli]SMF64146.1 D-amino-acid:oxygen oxidoreductase [Trinickia caryophylli]